MVGLAGECEVCEARRAEADSLRTRIVELEAEVFALGDELAEALKVVDLQKADLDRYEKAIQDARPNQPERTPTEQLQLGWARILGFEAQAANDDGAPAEPDSDTLETMSPPGGQGRGGEGRKRGPHRHGRRGTPDFALLPSQEIIIDPPEVLASGGAGFRCVGEETSRRVAFQPSSYLCLVTRRRKWVRVPDRLEQAGLPEQPLPPVLIGDLPGSLWPRFMAEASAVANIVVTKYGDIVPLNRSGIPSKSST